MTPLGRVSPKYNVVLTCDCAVVGHSITTEKPWARTVDCHHEAEATPHTNIVAPIATVHERMGPPPRGQQRATPGLRHCAARPDPGAIGFSRRCCSGGSVTSRVL